MAHSYQVTVKADQGGGKGLKKGMSFVVANTPGRPGTRDIAAAAKRVLGITIRPIDVSVANLEIKEL